MLSETLQKKMKSVEEDSLHFDSMTLVLAINYGGRDDICHSVKNIVRLALDGNITEQDVTEELIEQNLYTEDIPAADLIIRPSGEQRLSNFLIWQSAYAEFYYTNILWPDFKGKDLEDAIIAFNDRNRRYGGI